MKKLFNCDFEANMKHAYERDDKRDTLSKGPTFFFFHARVSNHGGNSTFGTSREALKSSTCPTLELK